MSKIEGLPRKIQEKLESFARFTGMCWVTNDYDKLVCFETNRPITHNKPIEESVDMFGPQNRSADVAFVEGEFIIMDGQGRHHVFKERGLPYGFAFHPEITTREQVITFIAAANAAQTKFKLHDFGHLHSLVSRYHRQFEDLIEFSYVKEAHPCKINGTELIALLINTRPGGSFYVGNKSIINKFKANDGFTFTKDDFERVKEIIVKLKKISKHIRYWSVREFLSAFVRCLHHERFDIDILEKGLKKKAGSKYFDKKEKLKSKKDFGTAILKAYNAVAEEGEFITDISFEVEKEMEKKAKSRAAYLEAKKAKAA